MQTAGEALKSATELGSAGGAVFTPMEENLDAVRATQEKLWRLTDAHEFETFRSVFNRMGAEELGVRVVEALEKYNGANTFILQREAAAARAINEQLDRQALITQILNDSTAQNASARSSLDETIKRIKTRLDWIEAAQARLTAVPELAGASKPGGDVARVVITGLDPKTDTGKAIAAAIKAAEKSLKSVESDKRVEAWTALIAILVLKYLQLRSRFAWSLANLVALLRMNLFTHRELWAWLDQPFTGPPTVLTASQPVLDLG
jgi:vacuolar-type H+-ATPase subunit E/Vma4